MQEIHEISDLLESDFPPQIEILICDVPATNSEPLNLHVQGLDSKYTFIVYPGMHGVYLISA